MNIIIKQTALATAILASGVSYAAAQAGPVDGKGHGGATAHRGVVAPSGSEYGNVAAGNYTQAIEEQQAAKAQERAANSSSMEVQPAERGSSPQAMRHEGSGATYR